MTKTTLTLAVCGWYSLMGNLQAQSWQWANSMGMDNTITKVAPLQPYDADKLLSAGTFSGSSLSLGAQTLANSGQDDAFIALYDANGSALWAAKVGGTGIDQATHVAADTAGNIYLAGNYQSLSMTVGGNVLMNAGSQDGFLVKYNPDKSIAWTRSIGGSFHDAIQAMKVDPDGNVYIVCRTQDQVNFTVNNFQLTKVRTDNVVLWQEITTSQSGEVPNVYAMEIDEDQNIHVAGVFTGTASFSGHSISGDPNNWHTAFIVKYDPSGAYLLGTANDTIHNITDLCVFGGDLYACAYKREWGIGWGWPLSSATIHTIRLSKNHQVIWSKTVGGDDFLQSLDIPHAIAADNSGNVYVAGYFFNDTLAFAGQSIANPQNGNYYYPQGFVFKYDANGTEEWAQAVGGELSDEATGLVVTDEDQFYLSGIFESQNVYFGQHLLQNNSALDSTYVHQSPVRYIRDTKSFLSYYGSPASGIPSYDKAADLLTVLYPNPAAEYVQLDIDDAPLQSTFVAIYTQDGKLLRRSKLYNTQLFVGDLSAGLYYLTLQTQDRIQSYKFFKQ